MKCLVLALCFLLVLQNGSIGQSRSTATSIAPELCEDMVRHKTLIENKPVSCRRLALVKFSYFGFDHKIHNDGEIVVLDAVAEHVRKIFDTLLDRQFPLAKARLLNHYEGDDDVSMADDNTSSFNDRLVEGTTSLSMHAYGLAIDLNPVQNPFLQGSGRGRQVSPAGGEKYLDRADIRPGMAETVIDVFADNGFVIWGGDWHNPVDYQHFQVRRDLAEPLVRASSIQARSIFETQVEEYHRCRRAGKSRRACGVGPRRQVNLRG